MRVPQDSLVGFLRLIAAVVAAVIVAGESGGGDNQQQNRRRGKSMPDVFHLISP
jgi:hypothetical protein